MEIDDLESSLGYLRKFLPKQGPLEFFVHHNTFHELEYTSFKDALKIGAKLYGGKVLKSEQEYREHFCTGKVNAAVLDDLIRDFLKKAEVSVESNHLFVKKILTENRGFATEKAVGESLCYLKNKTSQKKTFFREALYKEYEIDVDEIISPLVLRFLSFYFDQGVSYWKMPERSKGLLDRFFYNYSKSSFVSAKWEKRLSKLIAEKSNMTAREIIADCIDKLRLPKDSQTEYLFSLCLRYKGWGGLVLSFEKHPEWNKRQDVQTDFEDFVAVLLLCETACLLSINPDKQKNLVSQIPLIVETREYSDEYLKRVDYLIGAEANLSDDLLKVIALLTDFERCFLMHKAYEETFYKDFTSSFYCNQSGLSKQGGRPNIQVLCCIDDREESFRRHIELMGEDIETFGVAGHFGLDIAYKGVFGAHFRALCPDIISPSKQITERLDSGVGAQKVYSAWGSLLWMQALGSRTLVRGVFFQFLTGFISIFTMTVSVISPFLALKIRTYFKKKLDQNLKTSIEYENEKGLNFEQMVNHAEGLFKTIGLRSQIAPVVAIIGHGSHSLNNPHESAYNCGACGGGRGAPNARLMAEILNRKDVRTALKKRNLAIPVDTLFVGGYHNTCSNEVLFFDVPENEAVKVAIKRIRSASRVDALERCRKFEEVPLSISSDKAYLHSLGRANNYMQARPEYNHATNALCYVGPRWMSKDIFLDRRAFLTSYEPGLDNDNADILKNILSAVGPVCSGINLEYYFSTMDNDVHGCGTKLPHNINSLVGVMNGYQSDLQMGLNSQMVEIHEPFRLMLMVASPVKKMERLISELQSLNLLVTNYWIHLSVYDPKLQTMFRYKDGFLQPAEIIEEETVSYKSQFDAFQNKRSVSRLGVVRSS